MIDYLNTVSKTKTNQIDILLSVYNGGDYICELINSIIDQTVHNWKLIIRDDGSIDNSLELIQFYTDRYPDKIIYIDDNFCNLGPCQSFEKLMKYSNANYIMFCDQDDIWLENKIEISIKYMKQLEIKFPTKPILIHTDLTVVNKDLQTISNSFWSYQKLNPNYSTLNNLLIQNIVTGCTMMINKRLKEAALPIPIKAIMHDWWMALVASLHNGIYHIDGSTILYRQHGKNNVGAKKYSFFYYIARFGNLDKSYKSNKKIVDQGVSFLNRYSAQLNNKQTDLIQSFITLILKNKFVRIKDIIKYRFRKHGFLRNVGFIISMLLIKSERENS